MAKILKRYTSNAHQRQSGESDKGSVTNSFESVDSVSDLLARANRAIRGGSDDLNGSFSVRASHVRDSIVGGIRKVGSAMHQLSRLAYGVRTTTEVRKSQKRTTGFAPGTPVRSPKGSINAEDEDDDGAHVAFGDEEILRMQSPESPRDETKDLSDEPQSPRSKCLPESWAFVDEMKAHEPVAAAFDSALLLVRAGAMKEEDLISFRDLMSRQALDRIGTHLRLKELEMEKQVALKDALAEKKLAAARTAEHNVKQLEVNYLREIEKLRDTVRRLPTGTQEYMRVERLESWSLDADTRELVQLTVRETVKSMVSDARTAAYGSTNELLDMVKDMLRAETAELERSVAQLKAELKKTVGQIEKSKGQFAACDDNSWLTDSGGAAGGNSLLAPRKTMVLRRPSDMHMRLGGTSSARGSPTSSARGSSSMAASLSGEMPQIPGDSLTNQRSQLNSVQGETLQDMPLPEDAFDEELAEAEEGSCEVQTQEGSPRNKTAGAECLTEKGRDESAKGTAGMLGKGGGASEGWNQAEAPVDGEAVYSCREDWADGFSKTTSEVWDGGSGNGFASATFLQDALPPCSRCGSREWRCRRCGFHQSSTECPAEREVRVQLADVEQIEADLLCNIEGLAGHLNAEEMRSLLRNFGGRVDSSTDLALLAQQMRDKMVDSSSREYWLELATAVINLDDLKLVSEGNDIPAPVKERINTVLERCFELINDLQTLVQSIQEQKPRAQSPKASGGQTGSGGGLTKQTLGGDFEAESKIVRMVPSAVRSGQKPATPLTTRAPPAVSQPPARPAPKAVSPVSPPPAQPVGLDRTDTGSKESSQAVQQSKTTEAAVESKAAPGGKKGPNANVQLGASPKVAAVGVGGKAGPAKTAGNAAKKPGPSPKPTTPLKAAGAAAGGLAILPGNGVMPAAPTGD
eukprot:gnl/TRDRNA2_/TRDRNA2_39379_c0_seq1.p1 gnl/TRDRNA2_/TRDRNA2_39379_c0~~gnl/TRDRNA2_/TRDRNA2_39379_c0_seq1.p1  ORF type:complete len:918 (-),score=168.64 gnl/TRDRNA2_/TRDRNA2_39379_c0_seq1:67-2820(-)